MNLTPETMNQESALSWIAGIFEEPVANISPDTARDDIPAWDSLGALTLMASMDERFDILLSDEQIRSMTKVDDILEVLRTSGKLE